METENIFLLYQDECRIVLYKLVEQAVRDFSTLKYAIKKSEREHYETAVSFLFDKDYCIDWGDITLTTKEIADILELDLEWIKEKALQQQEKKLIRRGEEERE